MTSIHADPRPVAVARIGLGIATALNTLEAISILDRLAQGRLATPVLDGLGAPSANWLPTLFISGVAAGVLIVMGLWALPATIFAIALNVSFMLWDQQTYSSHRLLTTLLLAFLLFAQSDRAWSVRRTRAAASVPWWPQLLMMTQLSVCYLFAAVSKINPIFLSGEPLSAWVWLQVPWQFYAVVAGLTIAVELVIAVGLWFGESRRLAALLGVGLHASIVTLIDHDTLGLVSFAIVCLSLYPLYFFRPTLRSDLRADRDLTRLESPARNSG